MSKRDAPKWLVQVNDGLYGYYTLEILLCDLSANGRDGVRIFEIRTPLGRTTYEPVDEAELRERVRMGA